MRADAGFFEAAVLSDLEARQPPCAIAARMTAPLRRIAEDAGEAQRAFVEKRKPVWTGK